MLEAYATIVHPSVLRSSKPIIYHILLFLSSEIDSASLLKPEY
jgi:hypothetical protein